MLVGSKAIGFSCRDSCFVVESFGGPSGELSAGEKPVEELTLMVTQSGCELLEWFDTRAQREACPLGEKPPSASHGAVGPEVLELLFEQVGPDGAQIDSNQIAEPAP